MLLKYTGTFHLVTNKWSHLWNSCTLNRATYATALSTNNSSQNKGEFTCNMLSRRGTYRMLVDQDWTAVYLTAAPFRQGSVPLPVRMGFPVKRGVPPEKKGNLELIKISNFLLLTPAATKKHCEALKPFCTEWPSALDTDAKYDEHFPVKVKSKDYMSAGTALRNPSTRIVHLRVKLSSLNLDNHARKKIVKLVGESCPVRQQNYDYAMYLLTVLYHESWKAEAWESEKTVADMEEYSWENSPSQKNALSTLRYRDSVTRLKNEGESEGSVLQYREAVKKLLKL
uniref:Ribosomal protein S24/S35 mitochondrial conserved domain-containing protein n=1 Tax=Oncorhynchus mykiss TaxID=8022 RepID=A0A8C7PWQ9_ONCMY